MLASRATLVLALALPRLVHASPETREIERCLEANAPVGERVLELTLQPRRASENGTATRATLYFSRNGEEQTRALLRVEEPPDLRGTAVLLLKSDAEDADVFAYLPELDAVKKLKRRHLRGRLFETDLTYEDLESLVGIVQNGTRTRLPDSELAGRPVWRIEARSEAEKGGDARVVSYIDRETCVPIRTEVRDGRGELKRVLAADPDRIARVGDGFLATALVVRDVERGGETRLTLEKVEHESLPPDLFERSSLAPAKQ